MSQSIPKRLIQTSKTRSLAPLARASAANLQLLHPGWEYCYFDDEDIRRFVATEFPQYQRVFDGFERTIQRIDFFRYLAVFRLGGFYFDLDVLLWRELEPLRAHGAVFPFEELTLNLHLRRSLGVDWEIGNYAFGAAPGSPFLAAVIENCVKGQSEPEWLRPMMAGIPLPFQREFRVLNSTGPGLLTRTLAEQPAAASAVRVLFPHDVRDEKQWHQFGDYGVHLMDGSWRTRGGLLGRKLAALWESSARKRFARESDPRGAMRTFPLSSGARPSPV